MVIISPTVTKRSIAYSFWFDSEQLLYHEKMRIVLMESLPVLTNKKKRTDAVAKLRKNREGNQMDA